MIYDSIYRPWSPQFSELIPGLGDDDSFTLSKAVAILLVCVSIYVVFWSYDSAVRSRNAWQAEASKPEGERKYRGSLFGLYMSEDDYQDWTEELISKDIAGKLERAAILLNSLQYVISIAGLSAFAWFALGSRQAFCVFVGTVCILDFRKVWGPA